MPTPGTDQAAMPAVAAGHPLVVETACGVLRAGGNAFDAAIAAGFASTVAEPALTSLGGGGFLLAHTASGTSRLYDFFVDTPGRGLDAGACVPHLTPVTVRFPSSEQDFYAGLGSVAVPGNLRGFLYVHQRLGRLPLERVVAPAVALARDGVRLNRWQAYILGLLKPIMTARSDGRELFEPGGRYLAEGDVFANPELADFLETLPAGGDGDLYEGDLARRIAADMAGGDGLLGEADLAAYRVVEREPLAVDYRGRRLLSNPAPSFGGLLLALSLRLLEGCRFDPGRHASPGHLKALVATMQEVDSQRVGGVGDPASLSDEVLAGSRERIRKASGGTTHVSVCDGEGNVASMSTSNGEGSGYLVPGTGVMLNNMMGEDDLHPDGFHAAPAGHRVASMMSPCVVLEDRRVRLAVGSGGSKRIRTALLQVISNVIDFDMDIAAAIASPRLHWDGRCIQLEPGLPAASIDALAALWPVNVWPVADVYFGGVHAASPNGDGAGDPRRGGDVGTP